ncbi:MAG: Uma2 family endonuclease [Leptolyngbyaceae cyanobacterium SM1_1_3]|nr:Uma2 family endonuclease [Leptolyngbyaceae cyanobacterium SM1_1_3]NJM84759.1 Uma2 family endonuclease [Leptolyngbyaceae cyanobacterium RM2_2_21]NJN04767.1 Uma2 family endonuclease [Leptolyngbyaceae cyanobacterium RM1_1_2]NJO09403.1 Uma2 family endonuclease [Leptolyngbyaceae cyanobacterium SL_1_1]
MTAPKSHAYFTPEEYLEIERFSPIKHEYLQGQMVAIAGASKAHVIITGNLSALLVNHLRGTECIAYATGMKARLSALNLFYYPDLAVACDNRDRSSDKDFVLYPKLIVEVLSDSTEAFDRGNKFADYKSNPMLEEYVLIHQKQILVEQFQRKSDSLWIPQICRSGDTIKFVSIGFASAIEVLYENIARLN